MRASINDSDPNSVLPVVDVDATFLSQDDGGRQSLPFFNRQPWYRPHIVLQNPDVRVATVDANGVCDEYYLGVQFISGPKDPTFNQAHNFSLRLMYHPRVDYSEVLPDATFTIREGGRVIGFGRVLTREN